MAVGSTIESLEITQMPAKREYQPGEVFDFTGLKVTAHFTNGTSRDVTQYLTWSNDPLTADDTDFQLRYPIVMYQNADQNDGSSLAGIEYAQPVAVVPLQITENVKYGDVNSDGKINVKDANMIYRCYLNKLSLNENQRQVADVNGDGKITVKDFNLVYRFYLNKITHFPVEELAES